MTGPDTLIVDGTVLRERFRRVPNCLNLWLWECGVLWDGGPHSKAGWGVFEYSLGQVTSATASWCAMPPGGAKGLLHKLRVYPRALRVSEAISNYQYDAAALPLADPGLAPHPS